ncbi:MAG TPA: thymidine phosphorylase [Candidatus Cloacimonadota bacterium]|nr:thymidine phosphorylase [Candidatus Cloacimonadota bacterium]
MAKYNPVELILKKRDGYSLDENEVSFFIKGFLDGSIADYQMSALLMSCFFQGLNIEETKAFTRSYIESGESLQFDPALPVADKHSTGGVGDKISIMLAPIAAALGLYVPMISGRGLGHTGGTLDKLETIPGFQTAYEMQELYDLVMKHGYALVGQSDALVPADKKIYALRDVTATVENPGLITASIMSKKIAEGAKYLVIDLKVGSGAFMPNLKRAQELAQSLVETGRSFGQKVQVVFTNMNTPLGRAVGNAIETAEAIEYLKGNYLPDTYAITTKLVSQMLLLAGMYTDESQAVTAINEVAANGKALAKFEEIIIAQNGNPKVLDDYSLLGTAKYEIPVKAPSSGWIAQIDSRAIGYALVRIKAGRMKVTDSLDPCAGAYLERKIGDEVQTGEVIGTVLSNDEKAGQAAASAIAAAYKIAPQQTPAQEIILGMYP